MSIPVRLIARGLLVVCLVFGALLAHAAERSKNVEKLIPWLLDENASFRGILFSDVIMAATGKRILRFDKADLHDQRILREIGSATADVIAELNRPGSKARTARRVNEMSSHFERAIQARLNATPGFVCDFPKTVAGAKQRSGYPDLRVVDRQTSRVIYLDPKLYAKGSRASGFRTFYFEPKRETSKVTEDARHLIVGIEHERDAAGTVQFLTWELIDASHLRVRLKAEFEASNADLYRPEASVGRGEAAPPRK